MGCGEPSERCHAIGCPEPRREWVGWYRPCTSYQPPEFLSYRDGCCGDSPQLNRCPADFWLGTYSYPSFLSYLPVVDGLGSVLSFTSICLVLYPAANWVSVFPFFQPLQYSSVLETHSIPSLLTWASHSLVRSSLLVVSSVLLYSPVQVESRFDPRSLSLLFLILFVATFLYSFVKTTTAGHHHGPPPTRLWPSCVRR